MSVHFTRKLAQRLVLPFLAMASLSAIVGCQSATAQIPANGVPIECLRMNLSPYSALEGLDIATSGGKSSHFNVEIANTFAAREQGLMCRSALKDDYGMLFEFQQADQQAFWMKDTLVGLDIIFIAPDGRIVSIQKNAKPLDRKPLPSYGAANAVLEVAAGTSDRLGFKPGDQVIHSFFPKH